MDAYEGFLLSRAVRRDGEWARLVYQGRLADGRRFHWTVTRPRFCFFVDSSLRQEWSTGARRKVALKNLRGLPVDALYFPNPGQLNAARKELDAQGIPHYEADINAADRTLMERFIQGSVRFKDAPVRQTEHTLYWVDPQVEASSFFPDLRLLSIDIECSMGWDLYSISLYGLGEACVFLLDPDGLSGDGRSYIACADEREVLQRFFARVRELDPDALIGWNVVGFDLRWLHGKCRKLGMTLDLGCDGPAEMIEPDKGNSFSNLWLARVPGRAVLDGIPLLKAAFVNLEDYSLATTAHQLLGEKKLIEEQGSAKAEEITRRFREDKAALADYNLEDSRLVHRIFEKQGLAALAVRRSLLTGLSVDRVGGSSAAFDFLYLPRLHRKGYVADTVSPSMGGEAAPGGMVLESRPGFFRNVAVLDFKSLYPSIIRTFQVDPLAAQVLLYRLEPVDEANISSGPVGLSFAANHALLPDIIDALWAERDKAKAVGDATLSQAVKIIMNSFYGVLGSPGCRFYDPRLAGTITRIGHWLLMASRDHLASRGFESLYGDTDSLFVQLPEALSPMAAEGCGREEAAELNHYLERRLREEFSVESRLELQFEKLFVRFFMPSLRGEDRGSKKRYAGMVHVSGADRLHFSGMESSRSDWTALAKQFQHELFVTVFAGDHEDALPRLGQIVRLWRTKLFAGELDRLLEYRKGLSKPLSEYSKNLPPHVRAARKLKGFEGRVVRYLMTVDGPEPVQEGRTPTPDHSHYEEKQLAPIADMVLRFFGTDYASLTTGGEQISLFASAS